MIEKIIKIFGIGRFESYISEGDVSFKKLTLIYGENGRGKTTLSAIFRSLRSNDPMHILERLTLGRKDDSSIDIKTDGKNQIFENKNWKSINNQKIEIFDAAFINENVFSGESVEHGHKKNLYRFVIGEKGVQVAQSVDNLDYLIKEKNGEITIKASEIQKFIFGSNISIEKFISLSNDSKIEDLIQKKEKAVEMVKKSTAIISKPLIQKIVLPELLDIEIKTILDKQISGILKEAEEKTKNHIKNSLDIEGETWIQKGLEYAKNDSCPFCGQNCDHNDLIEAYKGYFDKEYNKLKDDVANSLKKVKNIFSESALIYVQGNYNSNSASAGYWSQYISFEMPGLLFDEIQRNWKDVRDLLISHLNLKNLSPLEKIEINESLKLAISNFNGVSGKVKNYNEEIEKINRIIQKEKLKIGSVDLAGEEKDLETLKNIKSRHSETVIPLCDAYLRLVAEKKTIEQKKKEAKIALDQYTKDVFDKYQDSINKHLDNLEAGFEIVKTETSYVGGKPSSNYNIKINNVSVNLGDATTYGEPCFRNILSQGDKNCLAFAFFISKLEQDEEINNKVLIFDDPISSLDGHRRSWTKDRILDISNRSKQCIVMSHDRYFLRDIRDGWKDNEIKSLCIFRSKKGSVIKEWDIISETLGGYFNDFYKILGFINEGADAGKDLKSIVQCIRPVLEGYLKTKYPKDFAYDEWLGNFIDKAEKSIKGESLFLFSKELLKELKEINGYCKRYHHKDNPLADAEIINDQELKSFSKRAIKLICQ
ncbi:MAG: hypothetical protein A2463_04725 [Candidatus Staskawiczbacteria bacterium RIFOXYC2_FULL_32_10]|nr:MAG: hypothetical protein A2463_04725 [Candidatus Staskawiczbacteria bacterium RIFOXYC2_FULL_32_10]